MDSTLSDELDQFEALSKAKPGAGVEPWRARRVSVPMVAVMAYAAALLLAVWWGWSHSDAVNPEGESPETPIAETSSPVVDEVVDRGDGRPSSQDAATDARLAPGKLKNQPRVTVPPELIQPAAYMPHRGSF
jgi:negative regulator of sigma E activity